MFYTCDVFYLNDLKRHFSTKIEKSTSGWYYKKRNIFQYMNITETDEFNGYLEFVVGIKEFIKYRYNEENINSDTNLKYNLYVKIDSESLEEELFNASTKLLLNLDKLEYYLNKNSFKLILTNVINSYINFCSIRQILRLNNCF